MPSLARAERRDHAGRQTGLAATPVAIEGIRRMPDPFCFACSQASAEFKGCFRQPTRPELFPCRKIKRRGQLRMAWLRRTIICLPFVVAALLNLLGCLTDRLHLRREHIAGYAFLFAAPWEWLVETIPPPHNRLLEPVVLYTALLWVPAILYSLCLWGVFRLLTMRRPRTNTQT